LHTHLVTTKDRSHLKLVSEFIKAARE